jgi:hypothetical protein
LCFALWWGYSPWHRWCPGTVKKPGSPYYLFPSLVSVIWLFEPNAALAYRILEIANVFDFAFAFVYVFRTADLPHLAIDSEQGDSVLLL